jgi:FMN-dependent NADH-azoreductase
MTRNTQADIKKHRPLKVLRIDSSGRVQNSVTRQLADSMIERFRSEGCDVEVTTRDVAQGIPFVSEEWINANFTDPAQRSKQQREALAYSDALVKELMDAEVLMIGAPIYNFGIPAALKAWIDMIARARLTFSYGENGPVGLLTGKRAFLIMASGGTSIGSHIDFATGYLRHALAFVGINDVETIAAERLMAQGDAAREHAMAQIMELTRMPEQLAA